MSTTERVHLRGSRNAVASLVLALALGCGGGGGAASANGRATVGPAGGTVSLQGGPSLALPAGALAAATEIRIEPTGQTTPEGAPIYRLSPAGTTFAQPVTVTLPLPAGMTSPSVYWSKPGSDTSFDVLPAAVGPDGVQAQGTHFSTVFVGPSAGDAVCTSAGPGSDGTPCGGGRLCVSGACGPRPVLASAVPPEGRVGSTVTLAGDLFGAGDGGGSVTLGAVPMEIVSWSNQRIVARVPPGATAGDLRVHAAGGTSDGLPWVVTAPVQGLLVDGSPTAGLAGNWASPAQLVVSAVGTGRSAVATSVPGTGYGALPRAFSLELPLGAHTLAVQELDGDGQPTLDLLQSGSRQGPIVVVAGDGVTGLELPLRWHWEVHALDPGFPVCDREEQLHFVDADHGFVTFQVDAGVDPAVGDRIHGMVMATSDGGRTWSVASGDISSASGDFRPTASGWFPAGYLLALGDGTVLSIGDGGQLARSEDGGATWAMPSLGWAAAGPGGPSPTRLARAAGSLYVSVSTGGVQSSYERSQLLRSADAGLTWERVFDVCRPSFWIPDGCPTQGVPLGFAGVDMACSDTNPDHCITMGWDHDTYTSLVMVTRDGFQTFETFGPECGYFTHGQVIWFPGTDDAWVIASTSCPGLGMRSISTTDGGQTWSAWGPSPVPGRGAFADARRGMAWWDWGVRSTDDGGTTWRYTGHAPSASGSLRSVHVLDADHAWVLGHPDCRESGAAYVARWAP